MVESLILVVDDEEGIRDTISGILEDEGYKVLSTSTGTEALNMVKEYNPDLVILDILLPDLNGIEVLTEIKNIRPNISVIMISGHGTSDDIVKSIKFGAEDYLEKPLTLNRIVVTVQNALEKRALEIENILLKQSIWKKRPFIGESQKIKQLKEQIEIIAKSNSRVLIFGESGSGKELVAHLLHEKSLRADKPFVELNCAAIPQELIESELFGHEKGSFTGAFERKKGKFELAHEGTLFLDEIGDMSLTTQSKVLRVIETQEFQRVGGSKNIKVDVRIIAATNKDLLDEVRKGNFREDLYFRLNVIPIEVPPLREHKEDIPLLVNYFLEHFATEYGQKPKKITPEALKKLESYNWPGNVRELKNMIERLVIMTKSDLITNKDFNISETLHQDYFSYNTLKEARDSFERDFIIKKLEENNWNVSKTAEILDVERSNLHRKIKAYNIKTPS
jgi:two-component system nitrogen regulation response regulator NtrX